MFITNNHDLFHLWWHENFVKHQNVSKYYDQDCRLDRHKNEGGLIEFVKKGLICKRLKNFEISTSECICSEITIWKRKWLCFSIYRPPSYENLEVFF